LDPRRSDRRFRPINAGPQNAAAAESGSQARRQDRTWTARLDAVRILWYRRVVSFDQGSQLALALALKETTGAIGAAVRETLEGWSSASRQWLERPWSARRALGWLVAAVAAAAGVALAWRRAAVRGGASGDGGGAAGPIPCAARRAAGCAG